MTCDALQTVRESEPVADLAAAELAAGQFLQALGVELDSESLRGTPARMARAYAELFTPRAFDLTTFPNDEGYDELVLARDIPVRSLCEHHLLPFIGVAHVGYLPGERILGLSKLARVVELFARRPQVQERLTKQVADWLARRSCSRAGVGVVIEAEHTCMTLRGVQRRRVAAPSPPPCSARCATTPRPAPEFFALTGVSADAAGPRKESPMASQTFVIVGAGLAGAKAAETLRERGLRRADRARRATSRTALRAPAAVQGLPARQGRAGQRVRPRRRPGTPSTTVDLRLGRRRSPDRPGRPPGAARPTATGSAYDQLLLATGSGPARLPSRAPSWTACTTCAPSTTRDRAAGRSGHRIAPGRDRRRAGSAWRSPRPPVAAGLRGHRRRESPSCRCCACSGREMAAGLRRPAPRARGRPPASACGSTGSAAAAAPRAGVRLADGTRDRRPTSSWSASALRPDIEPGRARPGLTVDERHRRRRRAAHPRPGHLRRRRRRQRVPSAARPPYPRRALGQRAEPAARRRRAAMLGQDVRYDRLPYFYTDQYDLGMEYTGYVPPDGYDQVVVRGDLDKPRVHRLLAQRRPGPGRHERQRLGCHRLDQEPDPVRAPCHRCCARGCQHAARRPCRRVSVPRLPSI